MPDTTSAAPPAPADPALEELREAYGSGDLVLFVGAGVSAAAGLPSWKRLVEVLLEHALAREVDKAATQEILDLVASRQLIDALSALKAVLGGDEFCSIIERHIDDRGREVPAAAQAIAGLAPRLRAIITTNLDHLLERALEGAWPALPRATADLARRRGFILKLHGTLLDRSTWVFTREEYDRAMFADPVLKTTFTTLFHACPLLFVGYGLSDADFDVLLGQVRALTGDQSLRHYALVPRESATPHRRRILEDAGVRLISYGNEDGRHGEVVTLLRWLAASTGQAKPLFAPVASPTVAAPRPPEPTSPPPPRPTNVPLPQPAPSQTLSEAAPRRPRWLALGGALVGLAVLGTGGALAWRQHQATVEATRRQEEAARHKAEAEGRSRELAKAAQQQLEKDPQLALGLLGKAFELAPTQEVEAAVAAWIAQRGRVVFQTNAPVTGAAFSPDGQHIVTAGAGGESIVWELSSRKVIATFRTSPAAMTSVAFDAQGKNVLVLVRDDTARIWNKNLGPVVRSWRRLDATAAVLSPDGSRVAFTDRDGKVMFGDTEPSNPSELRAPAGRFSTVAFSPDGQRLFAGGANGAARIWEPASGKSVELRGQTGKVTGAAFSPDGKRLVTAADDGMLRLWDPATGKPAGEPRGHTGAVVALAFAPDGKRFVSAGVDQTARLWEASSGELVALLSGHGRELTAVAFSPDGRRIATASADGTARLWDTHPSDARRSAGSPPAGRMLSELKGHGAPVRAVAFSPDGQNLLTAGEDGTARLWEVARDPVAVLQGHRSWVRWARFSPDGRTLLSLGEDGVRLWDAATGQAGKVLDAESGVFTAGAVSRDGALVVTANPRTPIWLWDVASGQPKVELAGPTAGVLALDLSPDGKLIAAGAVDGGVWLWPVATKTGRKIGAHEGQIAAAAFSPDGASLVTAGEDTTARLWDAATGRERAVLRGHTQPIVAAQFSVDGKRVLTAGRDGTARLWDAASGGALLTLQHGWGFVAAALSPDGKLVLTGGRDGTARLWDAATGEERTKLSGQGAVFSAVAFSQDGQWLATADTEGTVRLWDVEGRLLSELRGHSLLLTVAFSPDGRRAVTASDDRTARIYACDDCAPAQERLAHARERFGRELTCEERRSFLGEACAPATVAEPKQNSAKAPPP